ncbi:MAG: MFS transporter [Bdellovibrionaceae bacterium]|nr:MFS transporter [Pseudobdellovibrionaceae bacterium]NUM57881.1 MFS transporter [Pseudobdellovibrionaceae bacterium]
MNYLIAVSFVSLFILGFCDNLRGPLFPEIIKYFSVSDTLGAAYFAVTSFVAFFASYFIRKEKNTYKLLHILNSGVLCLGISFAIQSFSQNYLVLMTGVFFFGISFGFLGVSQNNLVVQGSTDINRSKMLSGLHSMYGISSLLSPLYVAGYSNWGWQKILSVTAIFPFIFFVIILIQLIKNRKYWLELHQKTVTEIHPKVTWREKRICLVISFYVIAEIMLGSRLALYMRRYFDFSLQESSFYVTLLFVFMLIGRVVVSFYPPRIPLKTQLVFSLVGSLFCFLIGMYYHPAVLILCGLTMAPFYPLAISYISEINQKKAPEIVSNTVAIQALFVVAMHLLVGNIADLTNLKTAFLIGPVCMATALFLLLSIKKEKYV